MDAKYPVIYGVQCLNADSRGVINADGGNCLNADDGSVTNADGGGL